MFGTRVLINILSLMHDKFGDNSTTVPPLSDPRFARRGTSALSDDEKTGEPGTATSSAATASSGSETMDFAFGTTTSASSSSGATFSVGVGIEEVLRAGGDLEKGL